MNLTRTALDNNRVTLVLVACILAAGIHAYLTLPRAFSPDFTIRTALVRTVFPGAAPERVEKLVTDEIEKKIQEMPELDHVTSRSYSGISVIRVHIREEYTDLRPIWDSMRRKIRDMEAGLPKGVVGPFVNDDFGDVYGIVVALSGEGFTMPELEEAAETVRDQLLRLEDTARVRIHGTRDKQVFLEYDNARLSEMGLTPYRLMALIRGRNILMPGGEVRAGPERIVLEPSGNFESLEELRDTVIALPDERGLVRLGDVVKVRRGLASPPDRLAHASGSPCVALAVSMRDDGKLTELGREVRALLERIQSRFPVGLEFSVVNFQPDEVKDKFTSFRNNLLQAVGVVCVVMLVTLGLRTGLLVATLIPSAILMSMALMKQFDIGLDQVSLAALIIALGMLVDNAIVMSESIKVMIGEGSSPREAATRSGRELALPLLTSSLTTAAAFLPIYLAESTTGEYTAPLFKVVTITLLSSWLLSMTLVPLLCVRFMKGEKRGDDRYASGVYKGYRRFLLGALRHRALVLLVAAVAFAAGVWGFSNLPKIFFPPSERSYFKAEFELPMGTAIEHTREMVERIEQYMAANLMADGPDNPGVTGWGAYIGYGGPRFILQHSPEFGNPDYALLVVNTSTWRQVEPSVRKLKQWARENLPDARITIRRIRNGPIVEHPVEVRISGEDTNELFDIADRLKSRLVNLEAARNVGDDWGRRIKKIEVVVDQDSALRAGVTSRDVAVSLQSALSGMDIGEYRGREDIIPLRLRSTFAGNDELEKIASVQVASRRTGEFVPLEQVARTRLVWQNAEIHRRDRLRTITVYADPAPGATAGEVNSRIAPWLENRERDWSLGTYWELGGEAETSGEANRSILVKLPIAGFIILLLLVAQFNSLRRPLIILATIPLGIVGVTLGLHAADLYFGFMTLLGMVSLSGIVINNAIVLIGRIDTESRDKGHDPPRAVVEASQRRMRPILLTAATTTLGMIPLYFGGGAMWKPLAMAVIAGLLFATVLTLVFVPSLYSVLYRISYKGFRYPPANQGA
ncbi:MAG: efflux RND transporter permease subunit [Desulfatibacillaceae bacterium]